MVCVCLYAFFEGKVVYVIFSDEFYFVVVVFKKEFINQAESLQLDYVEMGRIFEQALFLKDQTG